MFISCHQDASASSCHIPSADYGASPVFLSFLHDALSCGILDRLFVIEKLRKTHWLADGMKATDSECDDRMLAFNP